MAFNPADGFLKMLARFRKGQSDAAEQEAMETWYASLDDPDVDLEREPDAGDKVWKQIQQRTAGTAGNIAAHRDYRHIYRIAAMLVMACGLAAYYFLARNGRTSDGNFVASVTRENATQAALPVILPDSSEVILEPGASIAYASDFNEKTRTVKLKGNAFFSVAKNKNVPFIVNAKGIRTQVLGTEFTISEEQGGTKVEVLSGKVQVDMLDGDGAVVPVTGGKVVLTANLKATYRADRHGLVVALVGEPHKAPGTEAEPKLVFNDRPLKEVIGLLEREYAVQIRTQLPEILNCPVTADLSGETLPNQLEIITGALNARFTVDQHGVLIEGGGCGPSSGPALQHP